jgi:hypothetical protein
MKLLHHLAILILPIVVLAKPSSARVESRRVAHLAIRDGLVSRHHALELRDDPHTWGNQVHRRHTVNNILKPRDDRTEQQVHSDIDKWVEEITSHGMHTP